jgi:hypothetical protein
MPLRKQAAAARRNVRKASSAPTGRSRRPAARGDIDREIIACRPPRPFFEGSRSAAER